jgi:hypothetical protein
LYVALGFVRRTPKLIAAPPLSVDRRDEDRFVVSSGRVEQSETERPLERKA